jgi:hypothetical protein
MISPGPFYFKNGFLGFRREDPVVASLDSADCEFGFVNRQNVNGQCIAVCSVREQE